MAGLDGLRAVAVLAVIAYHLNSAWAPGGQLGVGVFFVLSGYLITDLLLAQRERRGEISLGQFWLRRARRLLPALWVMLAAVTIWTAFLDASQVPALRGNVLAALFYYSNWWYAIQHESYFALFSPQSPLSHLWSLAVEEQFYLLWPLILIAVTRFVRRREVLIGLVLVGAAASATVMALMFQPGADPNRVYEGTDTRAFELLLGASLAIACPSRSLSASISRVRRSALEIAGALGLAGIVALIVLTDQYGAFLYRGGMVLLSVASVAAVLCLAHPATRLGRLMGIRPLRWIGVRSYGIYLWSYPIMVLTTPADPSVAQLLIYGAIQIPASFLVAALSWRFIEEPIRRGGFASVVSRLQAPRLRLGRVPAGLCAGVAAAGMVLAASAVGLAGVVPAARTASLISEMPQSVIFSPTATAPPSSPSPTQLPVTLPCTSSPTAAPPPPTPAATPTASPPPPPSPPAPSPLAVTVVGDSIMIDLAGDLHGLLPDAYIDGQVSRQMGELPGLLGQLQAQGRLASRLVVELGTNGPGWDPGQVAAALRAYGFDRVVLVNAGNDPGHPDWPPVINQEIDQVAAAVPDAVVVDWFGASQGHPEYFSWGSEPGDGIHPGPEGARVLSGMIAQAVGSDSSTATPSPGGTAASWGSGASLLACQS
ncbi:MAG TPA: acyltransferase family protein [Candidatus Binatia bacterium]|nr:acyltransferase family protein [Candidatus Binatia bacterium]